jgi:proteasome assembly chaperone (PAC2) family protein
MGSTIIFENPQLNHPYLVAGFSGWPDAGGVSTGVVGYLKNKLPLRKFGEIQPEDFYDFSSLRPFTAIHEGNIKELSFSLNEFFFWKRDKPRDLIIFLGTEPHLRWDEYVNSVLNVAERFEVKRIYAIGGNYDRVPHTREPRITAVVNNPGLKTELKNYDIEFTKYQGPASIHTLLLTSSERRNIEAISLWGHAPYYIPAPNPQVSYSILKRLAKILEIEIDLDDIEGASKYLEEQVAKVVAQSPELQEHIKGLEEEYEAGEFKALPEGSEDIVKEVEKFLKREQRRGDDEG